MSDVSDFLHTHSIRLNTDLGQHFLTDEDVLQSIVKAADIQPTDHIVEIGPGIGVLTAELLKHAAHVTAIEFDERMIPLLKMYVATKLPDYPAKKLTVVQGNALHVPLPVTPYKIVANIPYHITSPLLRHVFLEGKVGTVRKEGKENFWGAPKSMTLLIQREVAEKICDTEDRGLLTILVGLFGFAKLIRKVPPECFLPRPAVDSAVLHIQCFEKPLADPATIEEIFRLVKIAFSKKRKMLSNTLGMFPDITERLSRLSIDQKRRPQTLSVEEWIALATLKANT